MKKIWLILILFIAPHALPAQVISLGPLQWTKYCEGESLALSYTITGSFDLSTVFTAQISDSTGSFVHATTGSSDTNTEAPLLVQLIKPGPNYRVHILAIDTAAEPDDTLSVSADNGDSIRVLPVPNPVPFVYISRGTFATLHQPNLAPIAVGFEGDPIQYIVNNLGSDGDTYLWRFNEDASASASTEQDVKIAYATEGIKTGTLTVTNSLGCSTTVPFKHLVVSCFPTIPRSARVIQDTASGSDPFVWVKAGGKYEVLHGEEFQTVFVEPGGSVIVPDYTPSQYYLRKGATISYHNPNFLDVSYAMPNDGIQTPMPSDTFQCADLTFDYSQVSGDVENVAASNITVAQRSNSLSVTTDQQPVSVRVFTLVGVEVESVCGTGRLDIDLAQLPAGMYFANVQGGERREVRKIIVVH